MAPSIYDWSTTEANNATADSGINWQEGQLPSTVNNSARYMMRRGKELLNDLGFVATTGGTANTITLTASSPFTAYADGMFVTFRAALDNTGAATLNVNSVGAKNIYKQSLKGEPQLVGGEIQAGALCRLVYVASLNSAAGGWMIIETSKERVPQGHLYGLTLSNNAGDATNDIDIAAGECASDASSPIKMTLASALTKRLDAAWAVGSGNGGWLDGASMPNGTGHAFLIQRSDTGVVDVGFSASLSPTLPTNYDRKRRIGSILREAATIVPFSQNGDLFSRTTPAIDRNNTSGYASAFLPLSVPLGIQVRPILISTMGASVAASWTNSIASASVGSANISYQQITIASGTAVDITMVDFVTTNTSGQIYYSAVQNSGTLSTNTLRTVGWYDTRGRV